MSTLQFYHLTDRPFLKSQQAETPHCTCTLPYRWKWCPCTAQYHFGLMVEVHSWYLRAKQEYCMSYYMVQKHPKKLNRYIILPLKSLDLESLTDAFWYISIPFSRFGAGQCVPSLKDKSFVTENCCEHSYSFFYFIWGHMTMFHLQFCAWYSWWWWWWLLYVVHWADRMLSSFEHVHHTCKWLKS